MSNIYSRKEAAKRYPIKNARGKPAPCFTPDFSADSALYKEIDSLNEISIAQSKHELKSICQLRLQEVPTLPNSGASDDVLFDNIVPKSFTTNEVVGYLRSIEDEWRKLPKDDE